MTTPTIPHRAASRARLMASRIAVLLVLAGSAGACWTRSAASADESRAPATLSVQNQSTYDMTMYVYRGAARVRLGVARSYSTTVLSIPADVVGFGTSLRFVGVPLAGRTQPVSDEISVAPGDTVGIRIPPS